MKRLILTIAIAVMGFTAVFAQDSTKRARRPMQKLTAEQRAEKSTAMMEKKLGLNADQKTKVYALELNRAKKMDAFRTEDQSARRGKMKELKAEADASDAQLSSILTADQKTRYDAFKAEAKEKMKDRKPGMGRGNRGKKPVVSNPASQG